jgi:hypothetical protein
VLLGATAGVAIIKAVWVVNRLQDSGSLDSPQLLAVIHRVFAHLGDLPFLALQKSVKPGAVSRLIGVVSPETVSSSPGSQATDGAANVEHPIAVDPVDDPSVHCRYISH